MLEGTSPPGFSWEMRVCSPARAVLLHLPMRTPALPVLLLAAFALAACTGSEESGDPARLEVRVAKSSLQRDLAPNVSEADRRTFARDRADFAVDLFRKVAAGKSNVLVSPHSASVALAMTYGGTGAPTKAEMAKALRFSQADDVLHAGFDATDLALATREHDTTAENGGAVQLSSANSLWAQSRSDWEAAYLDTLARSYGAGINLLDFQAGGGEPARTTINAWVSERTKDKIPELIPSGATRGATWVLVNAIYLKATWQARFEKAATSDAPFATKTGTSVTAPTMRQSTSLRAAHTEAFDAVELPYDGGALALVAIAPKAGTFDAFVSGLTGKGILELPLEEQLVDLSIPKFEVRTSGELTKPLADLGMPTTGAFPGGADEIAVIQQCFLVADEDGTEAAAATAVIGTRSSAPIDPPQPLRIALDRPFVYAILDKPTGALLFLGQETDPTAK